MMKMSHALSFLDFICSRFLCAPDNQHVWDNDNDIDIDTIYTIWIYNIRNSLNVKWLTFWKKKTHFIDQKCISWKSAKNLGRALRPFPPPLSSFRQCRKNAFFPQETVHNGGDRDDGDEDGVVY